MNDGIAMIFLQILYTGGSYDDTDARRSQHSHGLNRPEQVDSVTTSRVYYFPPQGGGVKGKGSPYLITERRVPELVPVLGSQPAGDVSHEPGGRLPLLSARPADTPATLKRAAANFAAW